MIATKGCLVEQASPLTGGVLGSIDDIVMNGLFDPIFEGEVLLRRCLGLGEGVGLLLLLSEFFHFIEEGHFVVWQLLFVHQFYLFNIIYYITESIIIKGNKAECFCSAPICCSPALTGRCKTPSLTCPTLS